MNMQSECFNRPKVDRILEEDRDREDLSLKHFMTLLPLALKELSTNVVELKKKVDGLLQHMRHQAGLAKMHEDAYFNALTDASLPSLEEIDSLITREERQPIVNLVPRSNDEAINPTINGDNHLKDWPSELLQELRQGLHIFKQSMHEEFALALRETKSGIGHMRKSLLQELDSELQVLAKETTHTMSTLRDEQLRQQKQWDRPQSGGAMGMEQQNVAHVQPAAQQQHSAPWSDAPSGSEQPSEYFRRSSLSSSDETPMVARAAVASRKAHPWM